MKEVISITVESREDYVVIMNALSNHAKIESLYDDVFRKLIKYGTDEKEIEIVESIWHRCNEHFQQ